VSSPLPTSAFEFNNRASDATDEIEELEWAPAKESLLIPDSHIHASPFKIVHHDWDRDLYQSPGNIFYYVNRGTDILVASAALKILSLATNGRMTPQRIWRMVMHNQPQWDGFDGIDYYGDISDPRNLGELPINTPGDNYYHGIWEYYPASPCNIVGGLEELGDSEVIRHKLIWEGKYWVWMNPDWYAPPLLVARLTLRFTFYFLLFLLSGF
jgi:hypothetical protein